MRPPVEQEAARWAIMLRDPDVSFEDIDRALNWINSTPDRKRAFDRTQQFLTACDAIGSIPPTHDCALSTRRMTSLREWFHGGKAMIAASLALLLLGVGTLVIDRLPFEQQAESARFATSIGHIRVVHLPDGSKVTLGGASAIRVSFDSAARRIDLVEGEALFDVVKDSGRPFVVAAGSGSVTAVGTSFDVHRQIGGATVTVIHGVVDVVTQKPSFLAKRRIGPAMQVSYSSDAVLSEVRDVDPQAATGWRRGELNFYNEPFVSVVQDLNRYSATQITIKEDDLRSMPITGVAQQDGIIEWLNSLGTVMNFEVLQHSDRIELRSRNAKI